GAVTRPELDCGVVRKIEQVSTAEAVAGVRAEVVIVVVAEAGGQMEVVREVADDFAVYASVVTPGAVVQGLFQVTAPDEVDTGQLRRGADVFPALEFAERGESGNAV